MVPHDACLIILLMDQDMYEDDHDFYYCGRACGGSELRLF